MNFHAFGMMADNFGLQSLDVSCYISFWRLGPHNETEYGSNYFRPLCLTEYDCRRTDGRKMA